MRFNPFETYAPAHQPARSPAQSDAGGYLASSQDLRSGLQVGFVSLAGLPHEVVVELLRLRRSQFQARP